MQYHVHNLLVHTTCTHHLTIVTDYQTVNDHNKMKCTLSSLFTNQLVTQFQYAKLWKLKMQSTLLLLLPCVYFLVVLFYVVDKFCVLKVNNISMASYTERLVIVQ